MMWIALMLVVALGILSGYAFQKDAGILYGIASFTIWPLQFICTGIVNPLKLSAKPDTSKK